MSKELEAFYKIKDYGPVGFTKEEYDELVNNVLVGLKRLEEIENAKPNEAMKCLENLITLTANYVVMIKELENTPENIQKFKEELCKMDTYTTIKQALTQHSNAERCWKICKKYGIEIFSFKSYFVDMKQDYEYYKEHYEEYQNLLFECMPQAEFETLKEGLK